MNCPPSARVDLATLSATRLGAHGMALATGLAFDSKGVLYATTRASRELLTIDPATVSTSFVGVVGPEEVNDLTADLDTEE